MFNRNRAFSTLGLVAACSAVLLTTGCNHSGDSLRAVKTMAAELVKVDHDYQTKASGFSSHPWEGTQKLAFYAELEKRFQAASAKPAGDVPLECMSIVQWVSNQDASELPGLVFGVSSAERPMVTAYYTDRTAAITRAKEKLMPYVK